MARIVSGGRPGVMALLPRLLIRAYTTDLIRNHEQPPYHFQVVSGIYLQLGRLKSKCQDTNPKLRRQQFRAPPEKHTLI